MLQNPTPPERRRPRGRPLAAACCLLSLAVLAAGVTVKASAAPAPEPKKDPPRADAKAEAPALPDLPPPNFGDVDPAQAERLRAQMEEVRDRLRMLLEQQRAGGVGFAPPLNPAFPGTQPREGRLGVVVEKPGDTLVDQLELPRDQGLIVRDVAPDSAAARAGLKAHDILLEMDGKPVSNSPEEFRKAVDALKAAAPVDLVVMRKGQKETLKGLTLPEAKAPPAQPGLDPLPALPNRGVGFPAGGVNDPLGNAAFAQAQANGVMTTTFRSNDHFTTRHQEGNLVITLTGKVEDGKATVNEIRVQDGAESHKYDDAAKVPEPYRDKVKNLVEMSEKGNVKVDVKTP